MAEILEDFECKAWRAGPCHGHEVVGVPQERWDELDGHD